MSLLFNMLSRLVINFLPRTKPLLISWLQSQSAVILEPPTIKSVTVSFLLSICHEVMQPNAMILVFWMLSFKPTFSLSSFTFIKRLFSSSSLSATRVVSFANLRLLILLLAILIPACASSSPAFLMMYSAFKSNKDTIKDWNGINLTEAENIQKSWQEYREELYEKDLHDPDNHDGVITHLEPGILECKVRWALGSTTVNKASGGDGIPVELF